MSSDEVKETKVTGRKKAATAIVGVVVLAFGVFIGLGLREHMHGDSHATAAAKLASKQPSAAGSPGRNAAGPAEWNPFQEIRDMQLHMDQMLNQLTTRSRLAPRLSVFNENPGYSLSLNVQDLKDRFEVRAFLPNAKTSDVNVSLENNQTLKVEVSNKSTQTSGKQDAKTSVTEWGQYAQTIQLPAPVKNESMKIDHEGHELVITLPKAHA
jgi:HSP20 family molecular chaperone IbpA